MIEAYEAPLFRPPAEAHSLIAQLTIGCPNNRCRFCAMYAAKRYRVRAVDEFARHCDELQRYYPSDIERAFLADGDALMADTNVILSAMSIIRERFPFIRRFASYASAASIAAKSDDDLRALKNAGMRVLYFGIESGDAETLARMNKTSTPREMTVQAKRVLAAGLRLSVTLIVGLGGRSRSIVHAQASAAVVNDIAPTYTNMLALMHEGTSLLRENDFASYTVDDYRNELREFIAGVNSTTIFRANHASNHIPLEGRLPRDRQMLMYSLSNG